MKNILEYHCDEQGLYHRDHGPALVFEDGSSYWFHHGLRHRDNGAATEINGIALEWYVNNKDITAEVKKWINENNISYPLSKENIIEFKLRWL